MGFYDRLRIKHKLLVSIMPFLILSYILIAISIYLIFYSQLKATVTSQVRTSIEEKAGFASTYLDKINHAVDMLMYTPLMQERLQIRQAGLGEAQQLRFTQEIVEELNGQIAVLDDNIRNVVVQNRHGEILINNSIYSGTIDSIRQRIAGVEGRARELHGRPMLHYERDRNAIYLVKAIYRSGFEDPECQLGLVMVEIRVRFFFDIINNHQEESVSYALVDKEGTALSNISGLPEEELARRYSPQRFRYEGVLYSTVRHPLSIGDYAIVGIIDETRMYRDTYRLFALQIVVFLLSVWIILTAIILFSNRLSRQFSRFIHQLNETDDIAHHRPVEVDSQDEFQELAQVYNQMMERIYALVQSVYVNELSKKRAELKAFQAQINPHFLYNTLDCINSLVETGRQKETQRTVTSLASLMRMSIKDPESLTVKQELEYIDQYLFIQKMRYGEKILFLVNVPVDIHGCYIPKLVLQPLIENAILHGAGNRLEQGMVGIFGSRQGDELLFEIKDNGDGFPTDFLEQFASFDTLAQSDVQQIGESLGIFNIQRRIQLTYGRAFGLGIRRLPKGGSCVSVRLPVQYGPEPAPARQREEGVC